MTRTIFSLMTLAMVAVGCAHGSNRAEADESSKPNPQRLAKLQAIAPSHATAGVIVLYRNTRFGSLFGPINFNGTLWVDDQAVGDIHDDTYNTLELAPGRHSLRVLGTAPGIVVPLQATTIVTVAAGQVSWMELHSVQEFNNVTVAFKPGTASLPQISADCSEGIALDLGPTPPPKTTTKL